MQTAVFRTNVEELLILQTALQYNARDAVAAYALGNFWYDRKQYDQAIHCWEQSQQANGKFPAVYRNLSLAYYNKRKRQSYSASVFYNVHLNWILQMPGY